MASQATVTIPISTGTPVKLTSRASKKFQKFKDSQADNQTLLVRPVADIVVGDSAVTAATGVTLTAGLTYTFQVTEGDLYAISAGAATTAKVVRT